MQVSTAEFKKGLKIRFDGEPYSIVDFQHVKPGKGGAFVRTKLKHMRLGRVIDNTFRAGEKVELVDFEATSSARATAPCRCTSWRSTRAPRSSRS